MTTIQTTTNEYPQPAPELIDGIRTRLAGLPRDVADYVDDALKRESIERVANYLWKAGNAVLTSSELYEYRKTLFPPNSLLDPYTAGPPVLRNGSADSLSASPPTTDHDRNGSADSLSASPPTTDHDNERQKISASNPHARTSCPRSDDNPSALHETRQTLVQILSARAQSVHGKSVSRRSETKAEPLATDNRPLLSDLRDLINRHVILPPMAAEALALWIVHTYAFTLRQVTTYIGVVSPEKRCGKTTLLECSDVSRTRPPPPRTSAPRRSSALSRNNSLR